MLRKKGAEQALRNAHTRSGGPEAARAQTRSPTRALPLPPASSRCSLPHRLTHLVCTFASPSLASPRQTQHILLLTPRLTSPAPPPLPALSLRVTRRVSWRHMSTGSTVMPEHTIRAGSRRCRQGGTCTARGGGDERGRSRRTFDPTRCRCSVLGSKPAISRHILAGRPGRLARWMFR